MTEHTPIPWKVFSQNGVLAIQSPREFDVIHWSGFNAAHFDDATNKANAAFICKAVNNHDALVKALDELQSAESHYRMCHELDGAGHMNTGQAWVKLRQAGHRARALLPDVPVGGVRHD